jgi:hypothetical protein
MQPFHPLAFAMCMFLGSNAVAQAQEHEALNEATIGRLGECPD